MGQKANCPGCDAYTSGVLAAITEGTECPYCGLSAHVIIQVHDVRLRRADEKLKEELSAALIRAGRAESSLRKAEQSISRIRMALGDDSDAMV